MLYTFAQVIAHRSQEQPLLRRDLPVSGPVGRACGLELDRWIERRDVVESELQGDRRAAQPRRAAPAAILEESITGRGTHA